MKKPSLNPIILMAVPFAFVAVPINLINIFQGNAAWYDWVSIIVNPVIIYWHFKAWIWILFEDTRRKDEY